MKIRIVYDNTIHQNTVGVHSAWGFSCHLETPKKTILFDTGAKGDILLNNMEKMGIHLQEIELIVISHEHWDHNGGLEALIAAGVEAEVLRISRKNSSSRLKTQIVNHEQKICEDVYTTGKLHDHIPEQSLVVQGKNGWYVLTGCAHPGVEQILTTAAKHGEIIGLLGGLHGFSNYPLLKNLKLICPCHCTSHRREILQLYPTTAIEGGVGCIREI
jgi:7,8-dihydropterin-6-yl-methyl-4-(beta-D-ribofuranosyl)aminobenzene 5'-phosphate synthase